MSQGCIRAVVVRAFLFPWEDSLPEPSGALDFREKLKHICLHLNTLTSCTLANQTGLFRCWHSGINMPTRFKVRLHKSFRTCL